MRNVVLALVVVAALGACGSDESSTQTPPPETYCGFSADRTECICRLDGTQTGEECVQPEPSPARLCCANEGWTADSSDGICSCNVITCLGTIGGPNLDMITSCSCAVGEQSVGASIEVSECAASDFGTCCLNATQGTCACGDPCGEGETEVDVCKAEPAEYGCSGTAVENCDDP